MGKHSFSNCFPHSTNNWTILITLNNNIILIIFLYHVLNVKLYVELNMNVKVILCVLERKRVGEKESESLQGENGGENFGGRLKTTVTMFYST